MLPFFLLAIVVLVHMPVISWLMQAGSNSNAGMLEAGALNTPR